MPTNNEKSALTLEELTAYLEDNHIRVRYNQLSKEICVEGMPAMYNPETLSAQLHIILHDYLKDLYRCTKDQVADLLSVIAGINRFDPVQGMLLMTDWDGQDRIEELYAILRLPQEDTLSRVLIRKWLIQAIAMLQNPSGGGYGADGMLVLTGPQGIGKTTFVKELGMRPDLYKLGQWLDVRDKDTYRRCTSAWLVELGELESTLRGDMERLKAFITAERDEYRLPYGRSDVVTARRTSLAATCNSWDFLMDPSGSRRFWTVPLEEKLDLDRLRAMDKPQLWRQVMELWMPDPQGFRLTAAERERLARRNVRHERAVQAQNEVEDILLEAREDPSRVWREMTVSAFKAEYNVLRNYSVQQISTALDKAGIPATRSRDEEGSIRKKRLLPSWGR